jgi:hypothetical protein
MTGSDDSVVAQRLAQRVRGTHHEPVRVPFRDEALPEGLPAYLREHLSAGETHYTTRPGLGELRQAIGQEIGRLGGPTYGPEGVVITAGEGESLFVTLLGLGIGEEAKVVVDGECRHRELLDLLRIDLVGPQDPTAGQAKAAYRDLETAGDRTRLPLSNDCQEIVALGGLIRSVPRTGDHLDRSEGAIMIGHLDDLKGIDHFRVGYAAGPPVLVKRLMTWKQALSICSAAPSQRAALFALSISTGSL